MNGAREEIREAGGDVVAVFQYRAQPTRNFCRKRNVEFDCLGDPDRVAYRAVKLEKGSLREWAGPQLFVRSPTTFLRRGGGLHSVDEMAQRPGTFVVGADGRVVLAHYNEDSADNPSNEAVLAAVRAAAGATG